MPEFLREKCTDCAQCDLVCPDLCFVWEEGVDERGRPAMVLKGIDYQYCKGCLKCVEACPFDALSLSPKKTAGLMRTVCRMCGCGGGVFCGRGRQRLGRSGVRMASNGAVGDTGSATQQEGE